MRAKRKGNWPLHLDAFGSMLPLFYAAGHHNYVRDGLYYLKSIQSLPEYVPDHFLGEEYTVLNKPRVFSGI